ncbi:hypothetical protein PS723_00019 [Pseudomonas fluorescens]|uniref:Uncharacterized protein n=1 Tax=Pseudomonas fluorescens TaxID=294 RepID=A0A5E6ZL40_PSEFL|nr:hypothetical protein PS723_00019 [Pseudomonas fluorescens]
MGVDCSPRKAAHPPLSIHCLIVDPALARYCFDVGLASRQRDQPFVAVAGDSDNSLSMRWVKSGARLALPCRP